MLTCKKTVLLLLVALLFGGAACGCFNSTIKEDSVKEYYADLDPDEGVAKTVTATLYYRLEGEAYLAGVSRDVLVHENERTEYAILRTLLSGVAEPANDLSAVFHTNISLVDVNIEGGIIYVTLSSEFLDESEYESAKRRAQQKYEAELSGGELSEAEASGEYNEALASARREMLLKRRLAYFSIVNTLAGYSEDILVICQVQSAGAEPERLSNEQLGIQGSPEADSDLLEATQFNADVVATPQRIAQCAMDRLLALEYDQAYPLFNFEETGKPSRESFRNTIRSYGKMNSYDFAGNASGEAATDTVEVRLSLHLERDGLATVREIKLDMIRDVNVYKIRYDSFVEALG